MGEDLETVKWEELSLVLKGQIKNNMEGNYGG